MPFPRFARRLFENEGAGPLLNKDIIPRHADTHAANGSDPISPASIGAVSAADLEALRAELENKVADLAKSLDPWNCIPCRVPIPVEGVTFPELEETRPVLDEEGQPVSGEDGEPLTETVTVQSRHPVMPGETEPRENWLICDGGSDGKGGTVPDLRGRMILGASESRPAGESGGSEEHTHSLSGTVGATTLDGNTMPWHQHFIPSGSTYGDGNRSNLSTTSNNQNGAAQYTAGAGGGWAHTHSLAATCGTGSSLPPYYALAYIMRCA